MSKPKYDSTVARIAGNILSGAEILTHPDSHERYAQLAVRLARAIVAETTRTEPAPPPEEAPQ